MYIIDADTTIKDLELRLGIEYEPQEVKGSGLSIWYDMLRHKQIQELSGWRHDSAYKAESLYTIYNARSVSKVGKQPYNGESYILVK